MEGGNPCGSESVENVYKLWKAPNHTDSVVAQGIADHPLTLFLAIPIISGGREATQWKTLA
jgi:hypothetical protein